MKNPARRSPASSSPWSRAASLRIEQRRDRAPVAGERELALKGFRFNVERTNQRHRGGVIHRKTARRSNHFTIEKTPRPGRDEHVSAEVRSNICYAGTARVEAMKQPAVGTDDIDVARIGRIVRLLFRVKRDKDAPIRSNRDIRMHPSRKLDLANARAVVAVVDRDLVIKDNARRNADDESVLGDAARRGGLGQRRSGGQRDKECYH
jgi:hypothetical protein